MNASRHISDMTIAIPDADVDDLRARLQATRSALPLPGDSATTGVPQAHLDRLVSEWLAFDWRAYERRLNERDHVSTEIAGQRIHAVHARSPHADATPLILIHGWPGSFLEHMDLISRLTEPERHGGTAADAFHVVIPSLPGFGFSTPLAEKADFSTCGIADLLLELMTRLGYERFVAQGGDIGAGVAPELGRRAPARVLGVHVNGALGPFVTSNDAEQLGELTPLERDRFDRVEQFMQHEFGYISLQSTRPGLVGSMLADSPVAQMAWMLDKQQAWTWPLAAAAEDALGLEFVLANASLYWFTRSAGTAAFVGYAQPEQWGESAAPSGVSTAAIQFAHDIGVRRVAEVENTIVRWTDVADRGGHFAALEEPELLVADLREFVATLR